MFLIIVNAHSKWVECYIMTSSFGSKAVITKLCDFMSKVGVPNTIVSDNGTSFTSVEFKNFCHLNGINLIYSPAYHPSSNGQAVSMVSVIKKGLKSVILDNMYKNPLQEQISKFLFDYRNSKNSTTGKSPAEIIYGRPMRSRLELIKPPTSPASSDLSETLKYQQSLQSKQHIRKKKTF